MIDSSNSIDTLNKSDTSYVELLHSRLLIMLKELHHICVENNITYYMIGGTALGARRHGGFIPWDDDADIGMPRPDYERFSKLTIDKFPNFLELRWYKNTDNSPFQFIKLVDNRTTLKEIWYGNYIEGLYIDIFPIDGVRPDSFGEKIRRERIWLLHRMIIAKSLTIKKKNPIKQFAVMFIKTMKSEKLHEQLEKMLMKEQYDECPLAANFLGAWREHEIVEKRLLGTPVLYPFEDTVLFGPEKMDEYLTCLYGDFMTPPPLEKQVFRHDYPLLDFNIPFREYEKVQRK